MVQKIVRHANGRVTTSVITNVPNASTDVVVYYWVDDDEEMDASGLDHETRHLAREESRRLEEIFEGKCRRPQPRRNGGRKVRQWYSREKPSTVV